ncbi:hypothetical protein Tco_0454243 [Tanacetum coccineum]
MESSNLNSQEGETVCSKLIKESSLVYETNDVHAIKNKMSKEKERCMTYFRSLHSHLQMQTQESKVDMGKALDAGLVVTENSETELEKHDISSRSRNDTHAEDADRKPINDKEPI